MKVHYLQADGFTACGRQAHKWPTERLARRALDVTCASCSKHPDVAAAVPVTAGRDEVTELLDKFSGDPEARMVANATMQRFECANLGELRERHPEAFAELFEVITDLQSQIPAEATPGWMVL